MFDFEKNCPYTITESLKKRFCKDTNIPIKIFEEPYFSHFLKLYDRQMNAISKYRVFVETVAYFGGESLYFHEYDSLKDRVIQYLNENENMIDFSRNADFSQFACKNTNFPTRDIFKEMNNGKFFVSVDMIKGNFTALHHYNPNIVKGKDTYEDFIRTFTDKEHFIESKYIRQVVFGNVNPRRQVTYEKYLMDKVLTKFLESGINSDVVEFFSTDEIVLAIPNENLRNGIISKDFVDLVNKVVSWAKSENINVRAEFFELRKIFGTDGFIKIYQSGKSGVDFKCIDFLNYPFVLRKYYNEPIQEKDKIFLYDGKKAKLIENIKVHFE